MVCFVRIYEPARLTKRLANLIRKPDRPHNSSTLQVLAKEPTEGRAFWENTRELYLERVYQMRPSHRWIGSGCPIAHRARTDHVLPAIPRYR